LTKAFKNIIKQYLFKKKNRLSAIVGSMLFNTLGVAACASLFAKKPIQIDWWPITRDSILFSINVLLLVSIAWDGAVMWWETCILLTVYVLYWTFMFQNDRIMRNIKYVVEEKLMWCQRIKNYDIVNQRSLNDSNAIKKPGVYNFGFEASTSHLHQIDKTKRRQSTDLTQIYAEEDEEEFQIWIIPKNVTKFDIFWYFFTWPIRFSLHYTIPNPIKHKKLFPLTFIMCIIWIGCTSYMVFWMVVIFGDTFGIPDSVIGLTFLAFGGCMPEAISAVIIARKGSGQMGVSNALGANCLAVLFSLGLPWFISTMKNGAGWTGAYIRIYSYGIEYTMIAIIFAVLSLYLIIAAAGYKLQKLVGVFLGLAYLFFASFAILVELEILFEPTERC
jgi:Ca2+/Na+ antiporter